VHREHEEIFAAAMARDGDRAAEALAHHIQRAAKVIRSNALLKA
jgi:DNA-binding GntR family transcriptional regulator